MKQRKIVTVTEQGLDTFRTALQEYEATVLKRAMTAAHVETLDKQLAVMRESLLNHRANALTEDAEVKPRRRRGRSPKSAPAPSGDTGSEIKRRGVSELKDMKLHPRTRIVLSTMIRHLRKEGEAHVKALAALVGLSTSAVMFHVDRATKLGLMKRVKKGTFALK